MPPQQKQRKMAIVGSRSVGKPCPTPDQTNPHKRMRIAHLPLTPKPLYTGKSSLTVQYVDGHFVDSYYPTIENTFSKVIRYRNHDFAVEMIDTAGQDEYSILNSKHFIGIHGYMIVYSVGSKQSFEMVRIIRDKILNHLVCFFFAQLLQSHHSMRIDDCACHLTDSDTSIVVSLAQKQPLTFHNRAPTPSPSQSSATNPTCAPNNAK
jgi:hypothetical protein